MYRPYNLTSLVSYEPKRTGYFEVLACVQPLLISVVLRNILFTQFPRLLQCPRIKHAVEHFIIILPFLSICFEDIYPDWTYSWRILYLAIFFMLPLFVIQLCHISYKTRHSQTLPISHSTPETEVSSRKESNDSSSIRQYRAIVYIATVTCILGRDLGSFRLRFAKSFVFGTALMDVGVGCFIFAMGLSSTTARLDKNVVQQLSKISILKRTMNVVFVLIVIGATKALIMYKFKFPVAIEEYGTHWNVFLSLGIVKILGIIIELFVCLKISPLIVALVIGIGHELLLESWLKLYLVTAERKTFLSSNREGISQLSGLLSLYLWGVFVGRRIFGFRNESRIWKSFLYLFFIAFITCGLGKAGTYFHYFERESRRCANISYVLWMVTFSVFLLGEVYLITFIFTRMWKKLNREDFTKNTFLVLLDRHGFTFFLIGNIMTGIVNKIANRAFGSDRDNMRGQWSLIFEVFYLSISAWISVRLPPVQKASVWLRDASRCIRRLKRRLDARRKLGSMPIRFPVYTPTRGAFVNGLYK